MKRWQIKTAADWSPFLVDLMRYRDAGKRIVVTVEPYQKRRSADANSFYWKCVVGPLSDQGHTREYPRRTTTTPEVMGTMDFQGLIQAGQKVAAELGIVLPDQEEDHK